MLSQLKLSLTYTTKNQYKEPVLNAADCPAEHREVPDKEDLVHILHNIQMTHRIFMEVNKAICISELRTQLFLIYHNVFFAK